LSNQNYPFFPWDVVAVIVNITVFNPLNTELNPICHLLALLGAHHILHVGRIRVNGENSEYASALKLRKQSSLM
jgi:hypothetical protein